jgi:Flp pilus assembly protein TadG
VRKFRNQRGTALVEFALVLPFLAMLVFGTVDLGRAYQLQNRLKNAAREGARVAQFYPQKVVTTGASCGANGDNITDAATQEGGAGGSNGFNVIVTNMNTNTAITGCTVSRTIAGGTRIRIQVTKSFNVLTPFISNFVGSPLNLKGTQEVVVQGT